MAAKKPAAKTEKPTKMKSGAGAAMAEHSKDAEAAPKSAAVKPAAKPAKASAPKAKVTRAPAKSKAPAKAAPAKVAAARTSTAKSPKAKSSSKPRSAKASADQSESLAGTVLRKVKSTAEGAVALANSVIGRS
jgi:hypothetical protein